MSSGEFSTIHIQSIDVLNADPLNLSNTPRHLSHPPRFYYFLFGLFFVSNLWTFVLTLLPVVTDVSPNNYYGHHPDWYTGSDVVRIVEPIGGGLFNFFLFFHSGILNSASASASTNLSKRDLSCVVFFLLGLGIYHQGAGFHSAATMIKSALDTLDDDAVNNSRDFKDLFYYLRTLWEHIISHYLYAVGLGMMHAAQAYAYRHHSVCPPSTSTSTSSPSQADLPRSLLATMAGASLILGLLISATAINFPSGLLVFLIYVVLYGGGVLGGFLWSEYKTRGDGTVVRFGRRPVLHYFLLAYLIALVIIVAWIIAVGGLKTRSQALG
eukprot:gene8020-8845_t